MLDAPKSTDHRGVLVALGEVVTCPNRRQVVRSAYLNTVDPDDQCGKCRGRGYLREHDQGWSANYATYSTNRPSVYACPKCGGLGVPA